MAAGRSTHRETLRGAGLRATLARVAVLELLDRARGPVTHAELADKLVPRGIDRATVYRNLVDLTTAGLVRRSDVGDHVWRFELAGTGAPEAPHVHAHFLCKSCGVVACLPDGAVRIRAERRLPRAVKRRDVQIELRGLCDACA